MNWDAIGAIGQAVSALALVIVIVQVRHARSESQRALSQRRAEATRHLLAPADDAQFRTVFLKANAALGNHAVNPVVTALVEQAGLTEENAFWLWTHEVGWWTYRLQTIPSADELPEMERRMFDNGCRIAYGQPGTGRVVYEVFIKPSQHPDAVRYIENLLAQPALTPS